MTNTPAKANISNAPLNTMALIGFILSVSGVVVGITVIPGIVLSHIGMSQIKRTGESGRGFALAGLIVGYCLLGFSVIVALFLVRLALLIPLLAAGLVDAFNVS